MFQCQDHAVICSIIMIEIALFAKATMQLYHRKNLHPDLVFNINIPEGSSSFDS